MIGSALLRRYIGRRFTALRLRAGMTQDQAAKALQRSRATLGRMEDGDDGVRYRDSDVKAMLELFDATPEDGEVLLALTAETRNGRRKSWWHDYTETALPEWFALFVSLEDGAETIRQYESELIPGLLQTRAYAEQVMSVPAGFVDDDEAQRRVRVRLERQPLLTRPRAPHLDVVVNEAVIRRAVGGRTVMAEQLVHLLDVAQKTNVSVRVVPFDAGLHAGAVCRPFVLLEFPRDPRSGEQIEPPLTYVDTLTGAMYLNKPAEMDAYRLAWDDLGRCALDVPASSKMITSAMEAFR